MTENEQYKNVKNDSLKEQDKEIEPVRKTQGQLLQEALGLKPKDIQEIEKKLFIARFLDYFSEETLEFIYNDKSIEQYKGEMLNFLESVSTGDREEDKLLKKNLEDKQIVEIIYQLKKKAEDTALKQGIKKSIHKRLRITSLITTLPMLIILMIFMVLLLFMEMSSELLFIIVPLFCVLCLIPQFVKGSVLRKWYYFKEENRNQFYAENREDIMILKSYTGDVLNNIRSRLLDMKVPLQLIKFVLHSRDYDNLKLVNQRSVRGTKQYFFSFEYPPGMEPFPIPEILLQQEQQLASELKETTREKNFIVLTEMKGKDGVLISFMPSLRSNLADKINDILNNCEFAAANKTFNEIIPNSSKLPIYCVCGEVTEFNTIQICNWKNQFKFYLFEGKECKCGETIYVLSLMDEDTEIPEDLKEIFSS